MTERQTSFEEEMVALKAVHAALCPLTDDARARILTWWTSWSFENSNPPEKTKLGGSGNG